MPLVPSYIKKLNSYKPGKPISEVERELGLKEVIKLASNENPLGPSPKAKKAIKDCLIDIHRYPDASGHALREKLAKMFNIKITNVVLGSGSEGIMSTIMRTFLLNDDEIISSSNSFIGFKVLANASGRKIHWVPMKDHRYDLLRLVNHINDYTKIIYIANPDNPMGTYVTREEFDAFYKHVPERVLIILDEAYFEYANHSEDYPDSMTYRYDNVITLRSFSKAYGLGGVRIGYGFAHSDLISNLMKVKVPFEPSSLAQAAAFSALDDKDFLSKSLLLNRDGFKFLTKQFHKLKVKYIDSATNFITTRWDSAEQAILVTQKLLEHGIIVRHLASFGWPKYVRISIGLKEENQKLINCMNKIL